MISPDTGDAPVGPPPTRRRIAGAIGWTAGGQVVTQVLWFGSLLVLASIVAPGAFGTVAAGLAIVHVSTTLLGSGVRGALITAPVLTRHGVRAGTLRAALTGAALTAALAAAAPLLVDAIAKGGDPWILRALSPAIFLYSLMVVPMAVLQRDLQARRQSQTTVLAVVIASVLATGLGLAGADEWALVLRQVLYAGFAAGLAWRAAWPLIGSLQRDATDPESRSGGGSAWFVVLAMATFVALNLDYVVIGNQLGSERLGLYSLAFMIAFAPLTQLSWQIGKVLFPATAATADPAVVAHRTTRAIVMFSLVLLPLLAPAIVLAPTLLPALLGAEWRGMVGPLQVLLVVGAVHGLANLVGDSLSGTGQVRLHAIFHVVLASSMAVLLLILVPAHGIDGAAAAHALAAVPFCTAYFVIGARRVGVGTRHLFEALAPVLIAIGVQVGVTVAVLAAVRGAGAHSGVAAAAGAAAGLLALGGVALASRRGPLADVRRYLSARLG